MSCRKRLRLLTTLMDYNQPMKYIITILISLVLSTAHVIAADLVDGIVAVVGDNMILLSDLQMKMSEEMMRRNLNLQSSRSQLLGLREEVINGMVDNLLLLEKADRDSITIDMADVDTELRNSIANLKTRAGSDDAYKKALEDYGITELELKNMYRDKISKDMIREKLKQKILMHISVNPQDIDEWFTVNKDSLSSQRIPDQYRVSHILIRPKVSEEKRHEAREKIAALLERVKAGENFEDLAKQNSQDPGSAKEGGYLGYFSRGELVPEFTDAAFALKIGEVSDIIETQYGYHIIKVDDIRGDEVCARHILIILKPSEEDEQQAIDKLKQIREDIISGRATFEDMAKKYSEDEQSQSLGGKLDWFENLEEIPSFMQQVRQLKPGQISEPFKSQFGCHILRLDDYRPSHILNIRDDRAKIEELITYQKLIHEFEKILNVLRNETYIDVRLN
jgi:peptidyl-prolyl cis-trans isomerase SurA